jgi:DNA replication protein DnaC
MTTNADPLAVWAGRAAEYTPTGEAEEARADALMAETDREAMDAIRAAQAANRHAAYAHRRPSLYDDADYAMLRPDQNPRNMVATWWEKGPRSLTLAGPTRTGKTTAAYAIANHVHAARGWVVAATAADLSAALKPDGDENAYTHAAECDLLVVDDLGRERVTDWWLEQLQRLLDARRRNEKRLVVTTNTEANPQKAYDQLAERYGSPVVERLIDDGGILIFDGPAQRRLVSEW